MKPAMIKDIPKEKVNIEKLFYILSVICIALLIGIYAFVHYEHKIMQNKKEK